MAIQDMKGTVSTTGAINQTPKPVSPPDMSNIKMPAGLEKTKQPIAKQQIKEPVKLQSELVKKIESLTDEDKSTLSVFLSPSVSKVISKLAPEVKPLLDQFTKDEENVVLPVSIVKNFAMRKYGGTEEESVQSFVADLTGQMEQQNVPPNNQMVATQNLPKQAESGINFNLIDSDVSPQNMEQV